MTTGEAESVEIPRFHRVSAEEYQERVLVAYARHTSGRWMSSTFESALHMALDAEQCPVEEWLAMMDRFAESAEGGHDASDQCPDADAPIRAANAG